MILGGLRDADADLGCIGVPTLVMHGAAIERRFEAGEHLAQKIPDAVWHPLEGVDHFCGVATAHLPSRQSPSSPRDDTQRFLPGIPS
jgi:hypothetical protein